MAPFRGSNSAVECHLAKVDVESSNLFSRSGNSNENSRLRQCLGRLFSFGPVLVTRSGLIPFATKTANEGFTYGMAPAGKARMLAAST